MLYMLSWLILFIVERLQTKPQFLWGGMCWIVLVMMGGYLM